MKSAYPKIFEPITIKRTTIKNRIAMTPMGTNYGETSGEMSNRHMNYYSLRAKGGVGLIILENANIEYPVGSNGTSQIRIDHDSFMPRYYQLVENLHKNGATVAIQINHAGASASSARTGMETVSSSNIPTKAGGETPRPMTKEEIMTTVKKYGEAAKRVQAIGFDEIRAQEKRLVTRCLEGMKKLPFIHIIGPTDPEEKEGLVAFEVEGVHPHDVAQILSAEGICIRTGHHCAQPLHIYLGINASCRASFYFYNTEEEVDYFLEKLKDVRKVMGYDD